jgi:hypothetical protein
VWCEEKKMEASRKSARKGDGKCEGSGKKEVSRIEKA